MSWCPGLPIGYIGRLSIPQSQNLSPRAPPVSLQTSLECNINRVLQFQSATSIGCCNLLPLNCSGFLSQIDPQRPCLRLDETRISLSETWHSQELDIVNTWDCSPRTFWLFPLQISYVGETVPISLGHLWGLPQSVWDGPQSRTLSVPNLLWTWQSWYLKFHVLI